MFVAVMRPYWSVIVTRCSYLMPRERRVELFSVPTTLQKLKTRVWRCFCAQIVVATRAWGVPSSYKSLATAEHDDNDGDGDDDDELEMADLASDENRASATSAAAASATAGSEPLLSSSSSCWIDESDIIREHVLGQGAYGEVWSGRLQPANRAVAIKVLRTTVDNDGDSINPNFIREFQNECEFLQSVNNPHLVKFYACGAFKGGDRFIVTELLSLGSLEVVLHDRTRDLTWQTRASIALQVALGMEHLHKRRVMHRDLKSANIVLDETLKAKVCDFGLARFSRPVRYHVVHSSFTGVTRLLPNVEGGVETVVNKHSATKSLSMAFDVAVSIEDANGTMTKAAGTLLWMAPEIFRGDTHYSRAVDVYVDPPPFVNSPCAVVNSVFYHVDRSTTACQQPVCGCEVTLL
jgi:hypothetical protein